MRVWRLCRSRYAADAFSGEGARLVPGRWNTEGVAMAYAAEHLSLAAMELFVHLAPGVRPDDLVSIEADVPVNADALELQKKALLKRLPRDWRLRHEVTYRIGNAWANSGESLVLAVPSVIIDGEWNLLLNPQHADAKKVRIVETKAFRFDPRMFKDTQR